MSLFIMHALLSLVSYSSLVVAHGIVTAPQARVAGAAMGASCGRQVLSQQSSDSYGPIQGEMQIAASQSDFNAQTCNLWLCKGYQAADSVAAHSFTAGQVIPITVDIRAPHTGTANVSIVSTATNTVIGEELIFFDIYADNGRGIAANNTKFDVTMPSTLGSQCATAGDCVIQWWWDSRSVDQTYASCIDFTLAGGSGSAAPAPAATTPSTGSNNNTGVSKNVGSAKAATDETPIMPAGTTLSTLVSWMEDVINAGGAVVRRLL